MGKFVTTTGKNGKHYFNLKANNGQVILTSQGYASAENCANGIASVRKNATDDSRFDRKVSKDGHHYFNLMASNGQVIGSSEMYNSASAMENGIASVANNAPDAGVEAG